MQLCKALILCAAVALTTAARAQFASGINDNVTTPAPPIGTLNVVPQNDGGKPTVNVTHYVLYPTVQVNCPSNGDLSTPVNNAIAAVLGQSGGIVDARRCTGATAWVNAVTISQWDTVILLPCAQITATAAVTVNYGVRNTKIEGCTLQGGSAYSGTEGGTAWNWQGSGPAFIVGDSSYNNDTVGFQLIDMSIVTANGASGAQAIALYRTQEIDLERLTIIGDNGTDMTGIYINGQGNYAGGYISNLHVQGFGNAITMTGTSTGGANASTISRLHIDCPTSGGSPISGTTGINLAYGDGNTFTGGDVEGCSTMLSLGSGATNNTLVGVRNENSTTQVNAASGSSYNLFVSGGTLFTGEVTDAGTHNTFWDGFHRQFNNLNGDLWRSQADTTVTNHIQPGIGLGHVRGLQEEYTTDVPGSAGSYQNAWLWGPGDGTSGQQVWILQDLLNNVLRLSVQQNTTAGGNDQTGMSGAGTGNVCLQCATNAGTGGVIIDSGGSSPTEVAGFDNSGDLSLFGNLYYYVSSTLEWEFNCASSSVCAIKDQGATTPANVMRFFPNAGTEIDSQGTSGVVVNNTSTSGTGGFTVYGGGSTYYNTKVFAVQPNGSGGAYYLFPTILSASGYGCAQLDTSGYLTNSGNPCGDMTTAQAIPNGSTGTTQSLGDTSTKLATDQFASEIVNQVLLVPDTATGAASGTNYIAIMGPMNVSSSTTARQMAFPRSGTLSNFYVCLETAQGSTGGLQLNVQSGTLGSALSNGTAPTVSFAAGASPPDCQTDTTHTLSYTAGQGLDIQIVNSSSNTSAALAVVYIEFTAAH